MDDGEPISRREGARASIAWLTRRALSATSDVMMPPVCLACRSRLDAHDALCPPCWQQIEFIRPPLCDRLGLPMPFDTGGVMISAAAAARPPDYDRARAAARYVGVVRDLLHAFKYADRPDARRMLGRWLADAAHALLPGADVIVPVPLHRWRLLKRRFNQSAILAAELAHLTGLPADPLALVRRRRTPAQVGLTHDQRRRNVSGAFAVPLGRRDHISGRRVLLVDDVITTGATVEACARALRQSGAARVDVVAVAMVSDAVLLPR